MNDLARIFQGSILFAAIIAKMKLLQWLTDQLKLNMLDMKASLPMVRIWISGIGMVRIFFGTKHVINNCTPLISTSSKLMQP